MSRGSLPVLERPVPPQVLRWEGAVVFALISACLLSIPLSIGAMGVSWDALNHHIYLGWTAQQHRFDLDHLGAGYQSFQSPYLYWPFYRMAVGGWSGVSTGIVLASLQLAVVWPLWMITRLCLPGTTVFDMSLRVLAIALGLMSSVVLSAFGSSMNDVLAAAPLVWAVALAMKPAIGRPSWPTRIVMRYVALSGLCAGLSVAFKLSNGPLAILMPGLWLLCGREWTGRLVATLLGSLATLLGFLLGYGYWGWLLWRYFGNPVYPFHHDLFTPLRLWLGWAG